MGAKRDDDMEEMIPRDFSVIPKQRGISANFGISDASSLPRRAMKADLIRQSPPRRYVEHFTRNSGSLPLPSWQLSADR